jgi:putative phage-type endonuclease
MKIIDLTQGSKDWKEWRNAGIGASVAPAIMDVSPWTTPFEAWAELTGLCERAPANEFALAAMKRGNDLEPEARRLSEKQLGRAYPAIAAEHDDYAFIRASFDGYDASTNTILEIKCPGKEDYAKALKGQVPKKYYPQVQQQMLVAGATLCYYATWDGKSDHVIIVEVPRDEAYIAELTGKLIAFWNLVQMTIPPPHTEKDLKRIVARVADATKRLNNAVKALSLISGS